jgi:hypothetical protein
VETVKQLTDDVHAEGLANLGLCADLTLVSSRVSNLWRADFECPLVGPVRMQGLEALVISVRENPHREDVQVSLADPGHGPVAQIADSAVQVGALPHRGCHLTAGRVVEVRLREGLFPVGGVVLYHRSCDKRVAVCQSARLELQYIHTSIHPYIHTSIQKFGQET